MKTKPETYTRPQELEQAMLTIRKYALKKRWENTPKKERSRIASDMAKKYWSTLSTKERSLEMKRRAKKRYEKSLEKDISKKED